MSATSLAVLGFLGAGQTPSNRASYLDPVTGDEMRQGEVVRAGLKWLLAEQHALDGGVAQPSDFELLEDALATLAFCEAYGITNAVAYRAPAQRAVKSLEAAHVAGLGWGWSRGAESAIEPTFWCLLALESAKIDGLEVDVEALASARAWVRSHGLGAVRSSSAHPKEAACGLLALAFERRNAKENRAEVAADACAALAARAPCWDPDPSCSGNDSTYWFMGTLALFQIDGPNGASWKNWRRQLADTLHMNHHPGGAEETVCASGSWDVLGEATSRERVGGRVYVTAMNVLSLEIYYRYASALGTLRPSSR
ncbi:hypothetical protein HY251_04690 [bacterium]|nr:hypothetical protein [bacterium]